MKTGIEKILDVSDDLLSHCYCIVDQTRPGEAVALYHTLRDDIERRGYDLFVFNGAAFPLGFIKGKILSVPHFAPINQYGIQAKIESLYVDRRYQHVGIGGMLLAEYEKYCREKDVSAIVLYSAPTPQAKKFYEKFGYKQVNKNLLMLKQLSR